MKNIIDDFLDMASWVTGGTIANEIKKILLKSFGGIDGMRFKINKQMNSHHKKTKRNGTAR
jgi:hypothetical protein